MIQVEGLTKYYGDTLALDNLSFQVAEGEILGFLGPNGAGKTTTMRMLTGYMPPSEGTATVAGYDIFHDSIKVRQRVGYMPETVPLYREMSVHSYLDFMASIRGVREREKAIDRVLDACGIGDVRTKLIGHLSKGYRQRVGLAQALVHDPEVLVLDEPTIGLDPRQILAVRELIKSLGGERTIILSTHILPEVSQVCQRVLILNHGRVVAEDTPEHLTASLQGATRIKLILAQTAADAVKKLQALNGVEKADAVGANTYEVTCAADMDKRSELAALVVNEGWGLLEMSSLSLSLEEVFLQLTTDESDAAEDTSSDLSEEA